MFVKGEMQKFMKTTMSLTAFLGQYAENDTLRMHMPGHKGRTLPVNRALAGAYAWDITEISGADSLFEADGILRAGERRTAALYGSGDTVWSAGGSTLCIQAMLAQMKLEGRQVLAARTVHRAFLNACILLDLPVTWVMPQKGGLIDGQYAYADFETALQAQTAAGKRTCLYVTSPDYCGNLQDIAGLAALCRQYDARLLVDNAHGAHLAFLAENCHPMALGADFCCDSAHKMLPALTGAAMLHCKTPCGMTMKQHMTLFGSTSPSYPIMQSIEAAIADLEGQGIARIRTCAERAVQLRERFPQFDYLGDDPLHLSIRADGNAFAAALREQNIECEYADASRIVLLLSPMTTQDDFRRLETALQTIRPLPAAIEPELPQDTRQVLSMREAALAPWECVPVEAAAGRICAPVQVPCPPAVPLLLPGERITEAWCEVLRFYGIRDVLAVK